MAKPLKKPSGKTVTPIAPLPVDIETPWKKYFPYAITAGFFILSFIGILHHEMWRDEYQAWMVAADAHSIPELFRNLKYEGHPPIWHLILFLISTFTDNPFGMQVIHIIISTAVIFLFNRFSPFSVIQNFLFSFGYFTFFEYNLISRGYTLGFLLILTFCILYANRQKYILLMAAVLFLLSNNTIFGVVLTMCFTGILLLEYILPDKKKKSVKIPFRKMALFTAIAIAGVVIGYLQIRPEPDNSFLSNYVTSFNMLRAKWSFARLIYSYFPFPDLSTIHFWNTNFFVPNNDHFPIIIPLLIFLAWIICFMRHRFVLVLYTLGTLILIGFHYYSGLFWNRYAGHLFLLLIACCWLLFYQKEKPFKNQLLDRLSLTGNRIRTPLFVLILFVQFCGGVVSYIMDIKYPFSTSARAATFLRDNNLMQYEVIGSKDYIVSPLVSQLGRKILYPERKEYGSFIIYDQKRNSIWSFDTVRDYVLEMISKGNSRIILIKSDPILMTYQDTGETEPWVEGMLTDDLTLRLISTIEPGIVQDEAYYIYVVDQVR